LYQIKFGYYYCQSFTCCGNYCQHKQLFRGSYFYRCSISCGKYLFLVSSPVGFTSTSSNPSVAPTATTTYTVTETVTATGCTKSNSVTITVNPLPAAATIASASNCSGCLSPLVQLLLRKYLSWVSSPVGLLLLHLTFVAPTATTTYTLTETITATVVSNQIRLLLPSIFTNCGYHCQCK